MKEGNGKMNWELLKRLCTVQGVSGYEEKVAQLLAKELEGLVDEWWIDPLGNLIAHKKGPGKRLMAAAHMDQLGMIVTGIDDDGAVRFAKIGGLNPLNLLASRVALPNGTVGVIESELLDGAGDLAMEKMFIDIGAQSREEAERSVAVGDVCTFLAECLIDERKAVSPALDNRVGCFIAVEALKRAEKLAWDLYLVFTVQEEVGLRGAGAAAYTVDPFCAINLDTARTYCTSGPRKSMLRLGAGATIDVKNAAVICAPRMVDFLTQCAVKAGVPYQYNVGDAGGIDAAKIQQARSGVPVGAISVATRSLHSASEVELLMDIEACVRLAAAAFQQEMT